MSRLLFLLAVAVAVYLLLRSYRRPAPKQDATPPAEDMVRCEKCGVHMPRSESIMTGGKFYCCEEHRRDHTAK